MRSALDDLGAAGHFVVLALFGGTAVDGDRDDEDRDDTQQLADEGYDWQHRQRIPDRRLRQRVGFAALAGPCADTQGSAASSPVSIL
ncbi:MAG: hypothetical protein U5N53_32685, partial [Mycobacterium sp.]|nr:hypothetical protein [Mycobacterium sp.]